MTLALRLAVACVVVAAPTLLYLGLLAGLRRLRDDALLTSLAERDDAPADVSRMADSALKNRRPRADGGGRADAGDPGRRSGTHRPRSETVDCGRCGSSNMLGARYCGECLDELDW
ncbi:zinc ribbon domain-containing protein [Halorussus halobius]|uniref:zinc ribbon domain-containing protein n=1 Tax=Halorussus halobius TaxID=1710537 RepID=UPI001092D401|nr:zinc ribbon domain-containing protein [Halorussus halobius]